MFAVVSIAGFQEMVKEGEYLKVPLQDAETSKKLTFNDVLLVSKEGGEVMIGSPFVKGASVEAEVLEHGRDAKIRVLKFRRRKRYMRTKGHRQDHTVIKITKISL